MVRLIPEGAGPVVDMLDVHFVSSGTLRGMLPAGLAPGWYAAQVVGPFGEGTVRAEAIKIYSDLDEDAIHDDEDPCVDVDGDGLGREGFATSGCADPTTDSDDEDPLVCADIDGDSCDDCSGGTWAPAADGLDGDGDGFCAAGDCDDTPIDGALCGNSCADFFADGDIDGFGDPATVIAACVAPVGYVDNGIDCDDGNVNCDADCTDADGDLFCVNHDCDDDTATCNTFFTDADGDGFGDAASAVAGCAQPAGTVIDGTDCADDPVADAACNGLPGASCHPGLAGADICDGADNDCDSSLDEDNVATATSCGVGACVGNAGTLSCSAGSVVDTCDPVAGAAANDASCNNVNDDCDGATDEDYLNSATSCGLGACAGNAGTLSCTAGVESDSCDPLAGTAAEDVATAGTCSDSSDNDCDGDTDLADLSCHANTPPTARFVVSPPAGDTTTNFAGDASASFDLEEPFAALTVEWDWDGDQIFEASGSTSNHNYATPGAHTVTIRVTDSQLQSGYHTFIVSVASPGNLIQVTTGVDESNAGSTPASPGGTGFSLREAASFASAQPTRQTIFVPKSISVALDLVLNMGSGAAGYDLVGDNTFIDGTNTASCVGLSGASVIRVLGFEISDCNDAIDAGSGSHVISRNFIHDSVNAVRATSSDTTTVGPDNVISLSTRGVFTTVGPVHVVANTIADNATGVRIAFGADASIVRGNSFVRNDVGLTITAATGAAVLNNTFFDHTTLAINHLINVSNTVVLNNIFHTAGTAAIDADDSDFTSLDFNDYFNLTACTACTPGANSSTADPLFINAALEDFRLQPGSPLIDQGTDTGFDTNGAAPNKFNGAAPDMGAHETP